MKLQPDKSEVQTITAYGPGWIAINHERLETSMIVGSGGERLTWNCTGFETLGAEHVAQLASLDAEMVIFGSGTRLRFPHPSWLQPLMARRVGVETMDTAAACRTYNILAAEGRRVVAALLVERPMDGM